MDAGAYKKCFDEDQLAIMCANYDRRIDSLGAENKRLRKVAVDAWHLFLKHGATHPCDMAEVDAVREELQELGLR